MKTKKRALLLFGGFLLLAVALSFWWSSPQRILALAPFLEKKGEEDGQWFRDKLISCGPRAIRPTIGAIAEHSPWARNYAYLPSVLRHFGEPAKMELIAAIDREPDMKRRTNLIGALQEAFNDFSKLDKVLNDTKQKPSSFALRFIAREVRQAFPHAPDLVAPVSSDDETFESRVNPDFLVWWGTNKIGRR